METQEEGSVRKASGLGGGGYGVSACRRALIRITAESGGRGFSTLA